MTVGKDPVSVKATIDILAATPLFNGLEPSLLASIDRIAVTRDYHRGETVFLEGDEGDGFYIVADGKVKIFKLSLDGKEQILHIYGPGHPFGEVPVFSGRRFPANAQALARSRLLFIPREAFVRRITDNPSLSLNMLAVLAMRLREFTIQIENLSLKEVPGRLAAYLIYLAGEQGNPDAVELGISKGQLASLLGTIPETLSRIFSKMSAAGLIQVDGRSIALRDPVGLRELSAHGRLGD